MRKFYFTTMLALSLIIVGAAKGISYIMPEKNKLNPSSDIVENTSEAISEPTTEEKTTENASTEITSENISENTSEENSETTTEQSTTEQATTEAPQKVGLEYFDNTLFIGDSRTVGLSEYGDLGNAEAFADNGMSVYKIWNTTVTLRSGKKSKLEPLLTENKYDKIYIMLGINELGYDFDQTVEQYGQLIKDIKKMQPSALIFVEANLHITKEKSNTSKIFNNENIDHFNQAVKNIAEEASVHYLDVNEHFDDGEGSLKKEYTGDGTHVYGKYYAEWIEWILTKAVY